MKRLKTKKKRVTIETCELTSLTMEDKERKKFPCRLPQWDPLRFALPTLGRISIIKHLPKGPWNHFNWIKGLQSTSPCQQRQFCNVFDCGAQIKSSRTGVGSCCFWLPVADPALSACLVYTPGHLPQGCGQISYRCALRGAATPGTASQCASWDMLKFSEGGELKEN